MLFIHCYLTVLFIHCYLTVLFIHCYLTVLFIHCYLTVPYLAVICGNPGHGIALWLTQQRFRIFCLLYVRDLFERRYATAETSARDFQQFNEGRLEAVLGAPKYNCDIICQDQAPPFFVYSSHVLYRINI